MALIISNFWIALAVTTVGLALYRFVHYRSGKRGNSDPLTSTSGLRSFEVSAILAQLRGPKREVALDRNRQIRHADVLRDEQVQGTQLNTDSYYDGIERRLDLAFSSYERGRINIVTYRNLVATIEGEVRERLSILRPDDLGPTDTFHSADSSNTYLQASWALDAIEWCKNWAAQQEDETASAS